MRKGYYLAPGLYCRTNFLRGEAHDRGQRCQLHGYARNIQTSEWTNADLFFLGDTLLRGMPVARVAGFLNRSPAEVRVKARELKVSIAADHVARRKTA